ncbi:hypothetical protein NBRC116494_02740 [Aurantivibrio plasticivorans]
MNSDYPRDGYCVVRNCFAASELASLLDVAECYHRHWLTHNAQRYAERAVNSAGLTKPDYLDDSQRQLLFKLIASSKLFSIARSIVGDDVLFMNTQLFFDPANLQQKNYWHRDAQYHLSVDEQKRTLSETQVIHCRIPLRDERGIEVVPGTHRRWDTQDELDVRLEQNGRRHSEDLNGAKTITLSAGDLLVFSANMIHRGLYGGNRLSLDILYCKPSEETLRFIDPEVLPGDEVTSLYDYPGVFKRLAPF